MKDNTNTDDNTSPTRPPGFQNTFHPPNFQNNKEIIKEERRYAFHQLLSIREHPSVQDFNGAFALPAEIDRKKLTGPARKRRYPFVTDPRYNRKGSGGNNSQNSPSGRWGSDKNSQWRNKPLRAGGTNSVVRSDLKSPAENGFGSNDKLDQLIENEPEDAEFREELGKDEPAPLWASEKDNEKIKSVPYQFKAYDKERDHRMFAEQGKVPDEAVHITPEEYEKQQLAKKALLKGNNKEEDKQSTQQQQQQADTTQQNHINALLRNVAETSNVPPMPSTAIDHEFMEQNTVANTALQETRMGEYSLDNRPFASTFGMDRAPNRELGRDRDNVVEFGHRDVNPNKDRHVQLPADVRGDTRDRDAPQGLDQLLSQSHREQEVGVRESPLQRESNRDRIGDPRDPRVDPMARRDTRDTVDGPSYESDLQRIMNKQQRDATRDLHYREADRPIPSNNGPMNSPSNHIGSRLEERPAQRP
eukprot:UN22881